MINPALVVEYMLTPPKGILQNIFRRCPQFWRCPPGFVSNILGDALVSGDAPQRFEFLLEGARVGGRSGAGGAGGARGRTSGRTDGRAGGRADRIYEGRGVHLPF